MRELVPHREYNESFLCVFVAIERRFLYLNVKRQESQDSFDTWLNAATKASSGSHGKLNARTGLNQ